VKPEFEKITKEVKIPIKKAKHIRRYNYTTEQNLEPIEALFGYTQPGRECSLIHGGTPA
jgi:hypothetical protein